MSASCPRESQLSSRHDGRLLEDEREELETHLRSCPECQRYAQSLVDLDRTISDLARTPSGFRPARRRPMRWAIALAALTAMVAVSVGAVMLAQGAARKPEGDSSAVAAQAISLAFRVRFSLPVQGKERIVEAAPKVVVLNGKQAEIAMEMPEGDTLEMSAQPTLGKRRQVTLSIVVTCQIDKVQVSRKLKMVTQLGSPAMLEIRDERRGETLMVEVTPARAPR